MDATSYVAGLPSAGGLQHIQTARDIHSKPHQNVWIRDELDLIARHAAELQAYGKPTQWRCDERVRPYITSGWWVFECPHCRGGVAPDPKLRCACCFECGAIFEDIEWPAEREAIEQTLLRRRDVTHRNWLWQTGETVAVLIAENAAHESELI